VSAPFAERALARVREAGSPLCVGLDPRLEQLPPALCDLDEIAAGPLAPIRRFSLALLDIAATVGIGFCKPQVAFFERYGAEGLALFAEVLGEARAAGLLTIADVKRGDIGSTAAAYAEAYLGKQAPFASDAITINPYLGPDAQGPFVEAASAHGCGLFVLVRTSNPGAAAVQAIADVDGRDVSTHVARWITSENRRLAGEDMRYGPIGAVIGGTVRAALVRRLRRELPRSFILAPGVGAQGAKARDTAPFFDSKGEGVLVPVSRGIALAWRDAPSGTDWKDAIRQRMQQLKHALAKVAADAAR